MSEKEELKYYDVLYDFASVVVRLNEQALDGETKKNIEKRICRLIPAFTTLCGMDAEGKTDASKVEPAPQPEPKPEVTKEEIKKKPKPRVVLKSNLRVKNGWGICPVCARKCIKVNRNTVLVNFAMFCKHCKLEHVITWRYEPGA